MAGVEHPEQFEAIANAVSRLVAVLDAPPGAVGDVPTGRATSWDLAALEDNVKNPGIDARLRGDFERERTITIRLRRIG